MEGREDSVLFVIMPKPVLWFMQPPTQLVLQI